MSTSPSIQINITNDDEKNNRRNTILKYVYFSGLLVVLALVVFLLYKIWTRVRVTNNTVPAPLPVQSQQIVGGKRWKKNKLKMKMKGGCGCAAAAAQPH
jgi:flagellar biogenesis protein FliO